MPTKVFVDNDEYVRRWVKSFDYDIHLRSEIPFAQKAMGDLLMLLYECPLGITAQKRVVNRFVRAWIIRIRAFIRLHGYLAFIKDMKSLSHSFLKCFKFRIDGGVSFIWDSRLDASPIASAIKICARITNSGTMNYELIRWIHSWHAFLGKMPLTRPDLSVSTRDKWLDIQRTGVKDIHQMNFDYVKALKLIVSWLFDETIFQDEILGKHGPGNTNLGAKTVPEKEAVYLGSVQSETICPRGVSNPTWRPSNALYADVEKDNGSRRSITQESVEMMMAQQSIKRELYRHTDHRHVNLGYFVKFADQTLSRVAALKSSEFRTGWRRLVTADMSFASDLVSSDLVAFTFTGELLHQLMCVRTWFIDVPIDDDSITIEPRMYAGMGAATTFPVQTILFTAMSILSLCITWYKDTYGGIPLPDNLEVDGLYGDVVRELLSEPRTKTNLKYGFWSHLRLIRTYGDDIILQDNALPILKDVLLSLGLRLNVDKTFSGDDAVRESCGIYALNGCDITPLRFRIPVHNPAESCDFAVYDAYRMLANRCYMFGYKRLSRHLVRQYAQLKPFGSTRSFTKKWHIVNGHDEGMKLVNSGEFEFVGRNVEYVEGFDFQPLYEPYRGDDAIYLGIISSRPNVMREAVIHGEAKQYVCALIGRTSTFTTRDHDSNYYYPQKLFELKHRYVDADIEPSGHGSVPRGTRLVSRIAFRLEIGDNWWAWAPTVVG